MSDDAAVDKSENNLPAYLKINPKGIWCFQVDNP